MPDIQRVGGAASSRHDPARLAPTTLLRGRLVSAMRGRFERRLTWIEAGAGFGKSTLVAQAVQESRLEGDGTDVLVRVAEQDRDPSRLAAGLLDGLAVTGVAHDGALADPAGLDRADGPGIGSVAVSLDRVLETVWSRAPTSLAIIIDDVHRLGTEPAAWDLLRSLLDRLPSNGHLVICGRSVPPGQDPRLPVARLRSQDDAIVIDEAALAFTDDELAAVAELRGLSPELAAQLPRWPALATLTGAVGRRASIEYLWDEVLRALSADRRELLAAAAPFGELDDDLLGALGATMSAAELVADLPLVDATDDGSFRLHDLWIDALAPASGPPTIGADIRNAALRSGGAMLLARDELGRAAEAFCLAGDDDGLDQVLVAFARRPTLTADIHEIDRLHALLPESMRARAGARYLDAARHYATDDRQAAAVFAQAADIAEQAGEVEIELLARWRVLQFGDLDRAGGSPLPARVEALADAGVPMARAVRGFVRSRIAQHDGDPDRSAVELAALADFDPAQRDTSVAVRMVDLGRPEAINATLDDVLASGISDIYAAQAVWMQGQIDPDDAWPIARLLPQRGESVPLMTRVALSSVVVAMGVMAGAHDEIVALSAANRRSARSTARMVELFAQVADGLVELVTVDEATAVRTFTELLEEIPIGHWPERPYLYALSVIRGLLPGGDALDACRFGPSMTVAVEAGAALAALRAGDALPARALPWTSATLLRVHVPPPLLAELALATPSDPAAEAVLASLPHQRTWLRRMAERDAAASARDPAGTATMATLSTRAAARLASMPARPDYDLRIDLLGGLSLVRSDGIAVEGWDRRERVRHLLSFVALGREVARADVAAELWPDLAPDKAAANLRVNLHHLQRALQPDRATDDPPWFVQSDGTRLWLATEGIDVDCHQVDAAMVEAVRAEADGLPSEALRRYERIAELAAGDLLPEISADWVVYERMRLRSVLHAAACRHGELVLAKGEPEAAMGIAARAQRLDPLSERAHRLSIRCHLALGSASAARDAAAHLRRVMDDAGLPLEHESTSLLSSLDR